MIRNLVIVFALTACAAEPGSQQPRYIAHLRNDLKDEVSVYLADSSNKVYASFGLGPGGTEKIEVEDEVSILVTSNPRGSATPLAPKGKQLAKLRLASPIQQRLGKAGRNLFYRIGGDGIRLIAVSESPAWPK